MYFSVELIPAAICLLSVAFLSLIYIIVIYVGRIRRVTRAVRAGESTPDIIDPATLKPVSVIVYSQAQSTWLEELLPDLLKQDYPAGFEIIVVNEGASEATRDLVENLALAYPNLYLTYTPDGARNLSRKKLGITIGIKAARHDVVVLTDAAARVESPLWLQKIMSHYTDPSTDVVLGYAYMSGGDHGMGRRRRAFDYVADSVAWLTAALAARPYRGTYYNMAYTRELFFNNKGFSRSLNLENGDDDIFVSEIVTPTNTAVELSPDGMVMANFRDHEAAMYDTRHRHEFTGRRISHRSRRLMAAGEVCLWLVILCGVVACLLSGLNVLPMSVAALFILIALCVMTIVWRNALTALRGRRLLLSLPWLILMRPVRQCRLAIAMRLGKKTYYTWKK